jgi:hypothetical protein
MTVKSLKFSKERNIMGKTVKDAYRIRFVDSRNKLITRIPYSFHVTRGDITTSTNQRKIFHF